MGPNEQNQHFAELRQTLICLYKHVKVLLRCLPSLDRKLERFVIKKWKKCLPKSSKTDYRWLMPFSTTGQVWISIKKNNFFSRPHVQVQQREEKVDIEICLRPSTTGRENEENFFHDHNQRGEKVEKKTLFRNHEWEKQKNRDHQQRRGGGIFFFKTLYRWTWIWRTTVRRIFAYDGQYAWSQSDAYQVFVICIRQILHMTDQFSWSHWVRHIQVHLYFHLSRLAQAL